MQSCMTCCAPVVKLTSSNARTSMVRTYLQIREGIHIIFFLFLDENICCGYLLEVPCQGASNEYSQYMFSSRNKKNISNFRLKKYLIWMTQY